MPIEIDPETMNVDDLPGIWSPVQWELSGFVFQESALPFVDFIQGFDW
jgi:hypothetical protein